jgi:hypothetical protein
MTTRRHVIATSAASIFAPPVLARTARAGTYPDRPILMIVPVAAGGPSLAIALGVGLRPPGGQVVVRRLIDQALTKDRTSRKEALKMFWLETAEAKRLVRR